MLEGLGMALGELVCGLLGALVLRVLSWGRWQPGKNHFVEGLVGGITLLILMMLVAGVFLLVVVLNRPDG